MTRASLSSISIFMAGVMSVVNLLGFEQATTILSGIFLAIFIVLEWPLLIWAARGLVLSSLALFSILYLLDRAPPALLAASVNRAAFLACFVVVLSFLRDAAQTSELVKTCGRIIVNQTPGRRYLTLALGGHLVGVLMSLGTVSLLSTMIYGSVEQDPNSKDKRIRAIRLKRMTLAMLRGFCAVPFWAPTSVAIAIVLSSSLDLRWIDLLPLAFPAVACHLALGWLLDRLSYGRPKLAETSFPAEPWIRPFGGLLGIVIFVPVSAAVVANALDLSLIGGLFLCLPVIGLGWVALQNLRLGPLGAGIMALRRAGTQTIPSLHELRNELAIFAASGFLAILLLPQIDVNWLSQNITRLGLGEGAVLIGGSWVIILLALATVNPLVTASLVIETLLRLPGLDFDPAIIAVTITVTWGIVGGTSPFSASVRLTARSVNQSANDVGFKWNLWFALCAVALLNVFVLLFV